MNDSVHLSAQFAQSHALSAENLFWWDTCRLMGILMHQVETLRVPVQCLHLDEWNGAQLTQWFLLLFYWRPPFKLWRRETSSTASIMINWNNLMFLLRLLSWFLSIFFSSFWNLKFFLQFHNSFHNSVSGFSRKFAPILRLVLRICTFIHIVSIFILMFNLLLRGCPCLFFFLLQFCPSWQSCYILELCESLCVPPLLGTLYKVIYVHLHLADIFTRKTS